MKKIIRRFLLLSIILLSCLACVLLGFRIAASIRESKSAQDLAPQAGKFVTTRFGKIYVQERGEPQGIPILLVHGMGAWSELWRETMNFLAKNGFYTIALDMPPFGLSDRPNPSSLSSAQQALYIRSVLEELGIEKVIIIGHSFGGGPVLHFSLLAPEMIEKLILVDIACQEKLQTADKSLTPLFTFLETISLKNTLVASFITNPLLTETLFEKFVFKKESITAEKVQIIQVPLQRRGTTEYMGNFLGTIALQVDNSFAKELQLKRFISIPSLLIWGDKDTVTPVSRAKEIQKFIPNSQIVILQDVGHIPHLEAPALFQQTVLKYLQTE
ncbi:MAG: alpha/beta hydrolase [Spirochaetota bacterium]